MDVGTVVQDQVAALENGQGHSANVQLQDQVELDDVSPSLHLQG